ncbi:MAG: guanylate kinase [Terriglobia bacterium]
MISKNKVFVISGPSGVGKGTLVKELFTRVPDLYYCISATTRAPREGEREGESYYFLDESAFLKKVDRDEFLEWVKLYKDYYGTFRSEVKRGFDMSRDVVLELDPRGAVNVKGQIPEAVLVFVTPPSLAELEKRLKGRSSESREKLKIRLSEAREEMEFAKDYDYRVVNDKIEDAAQRMVDVFEKERGGR